MARSRDGVEIAYESHGRSDGDAPTVVLVHGWAGNRSFWSRQVDVLTERYRVVAVDLGGHGESGTGRGDWNLPAFGDDVVAVVEAVAARDVALVGHSMGGDAIVFAARLLGDRVRGLVWVDTLRSLGDEPTSSAEDVAGFVAPFHADFGVAVDRFARSLFREGADPALVDHVARSMVAAPQQAALGSIGYALNRHPPIIAALAGPLLARRRHQPRRVTDRRRVPPAARRRADHPHRCGALLHARGSRPVQFCPRRDPRLVLRLTGDRIWRSVISPILAHERRRPPGGGVRRADRSPALASSERGRTTDAGANQGGDDVPECAADGRRILVPKYPLAARIRLRYPELEDALVRQHWRRYGICAGTS